MVTHEVVNLLESYVHLPTKGSADVLPKRGLGVTSEEDDTIVWDPSVEGVLASEAEMTQSSGHRGERHLDADEFVYLVSGRAQIALEADNDAMHEVALRAGESLVVPQGVWHRVLIEEPSRLLFFNAGRTEIRPPR